MCFLARVAAVLPTQLSYYLFEPLAKTQRMRALLLLGLAALCVARDEVVTSGNGDTMRVLGSSGQIEFCPGGTNCLRIRGTNFQEQDADGNVVTLSGKGGGQKRVNNLGNLLTVGAATTGTLPLTCAVGGACGVASNGVDALAFKKVPASWDLSSIGAGTLQADFYLFTNAGTLTYNGINVSVAEGSSKFDLRVTGYTFTASGRSISFDLSVRPRGSSNTTARRQSGSTTDTAGLLNFPRFFVNGTEWRDIAPRTAAAGAETVVTYKFDGPFVNMSYDPIIGDASGVAAVSTAIAFLAAVALLVL